VARKLQIACDGSPNGMRHSWIEAVDLATAMRSGPDSDAGITRCRYCERTNIECYGYQSKSEAYWDTWGKRIRARTEPNEQRTPRSTPSHGTALFSSAYEPSSQRENPWQGWDQLRTYHPADEDRVTSQNALARRSYSITHHVRTAAIRAPRRSSFSARIRSTSVSSCQRSTSPRHWRT
jgi:hypothetical protein